MTNIPNVTARTTQVRVFPCNECAESHTEFETHICSETLPDTGEGMRADEDAALSCAYCQGCGAFSGDIRQSHCRPACKVQLYPQPPKNGVLDALITKFGERVCTVPNEWRLTSDGAQQIREAIHAYTQSQLDAAVQAEREAIAVLAEATYCGHYSEGDTSLKHFAKKIRSRSELPQANPDA